MVEQKPDNDTTEKGGDGDEAEEKVVHDHPVFKTIIDGDMESMRNYFEVEGVSLELEDNTGMTPLMHASWKGKYEVAKYLITQGTIVRVYFFLAVRMGRRFQRLTEVKYLSRC